VALYDWLERAGWKDEIFLDLDSKRGIVAGERWERRLHEEAHRCEAVLFLISKAWLQSEWCRRELALAHHLNKQLFGVLVDDLPTEQIPKDLAESWQLVRLGSGRDHLVLRVILPVTHEEMHVTFSEEGLHRLKAGLEQAGLDPKHFPWPPENDPRRAPYRGLRPLEADDAGIFFGRDAPVIEGLDRLRGLSENRLAPLFVILGASGAGKSSFLRAGLLPRLRRDDRRWLPLPIVRPERAVLTGEAGLLRSLEAAFEQANIKKTRAELRSAMTDVPRLKDLLDELVQKAAPRCGGAERLPALVLPIDQGEELFLAEGQEEADAFLTLLRALLEDNRRSMIAVFTIRSDNYERLQLADQLIGMRQEMLSLPPMPAGSYAEVIKGPLRRLEGTRRALTIEDGLVDALLADVEAGGAKDALPLLAFSLERLYAEYHGSGALRLSHYRELGGMRGSIEAAVDRALKAAAADLAAPKDRALQLSLLRHGLIPWLAGIDADTGLPRRRVALVSEIPPDSMPLIKHLVDQHLLISDVAKDRGDKTIEPAHEALLRQWNLLEDWLAEDAGLLAVLEGIKRACRDWIDNNRAPAWLVHSADRLVAAEQLSDRPDLAANLQADQHAYLTACRMAESRARRRKQLVQFTIYGLLGGMIVGLLGWINQSEIKQQWKRIAVIGPYTNKYIRPYVLRRDAESALKPGAIFKECAKDCPEMVVVPAGSFEMGSPESEPGRFPNEGPRHRVTIAEPFAIAKFTVTFDEWDTCANYGDCEPAISDSGYGRGRHPVINITWDDARRYVAWLARTTGKPYRLLTEAEWEYAARAGADAPPEDPSTIDRQAWYQANSGARPHPVGEKAANAWGLYDMFGNVWQWTMDCYHENYQGAPADGSAWTTGPCNYRILRGGSWYATPQYLRPAAREYRASDNRSDNRGMRVARSLEPSPAPAAASR
jgi:formylglycine-generating enzyme required for sulfatase activity